MADSTAAKTAASSARARRAPVPNKCVKCKSARPQVAIRQIQYCKACFVQASVVKFRSAQAKSHRQARTKTMVAFSGGAASTALLRLAVDFQHAGRKGTDAEPPFSGLVVGHVDESALFPDAPEDAIRAAAAKTGLVCEVAALEDVFALGAPVLATVARGSGEGTVYAQLVRPADGVPSRARLAALFAGLGSATDREDMLEIIKQALIADMARRSGCGVVLVGDSATRVAVKAMALTSRGRGFSLPLDVGAEAQWFDSMAVHRPMRDFLAKEIAFFNRWTGLQDRVVPTFATGQPKGVSIGRLAEAFIVELDRDFASTVSTVCRTLQKLEPRKEACTARPCALCGMPAEADAQAWRGRITIGGSSAQPVPGPASTAPPPLDIGAAMCYSCHGLLHHAVPGTILPDFCAARLEAGDQREALRRQIDSFFIQDDDHGNTGGCLP